MRYEKDPEQRFHTKTKQIFRKSVYSSSSCATCEWCHFSASPPLQAWLLSEAEVCTHVTVTWHTHGQNPQVSRFLLLEKTSPKVKWRSKTTESPAKHRVRCLSAGKLQQWFHAGRLLPPPHPWNNPQQGKGCWQTGEQISCCCRNRQLSLPS